MTFYELLKILIEKEEFYYHNAKIEKKYDESFSKKLVERGYAISLILEEVYDKLLDKHIINDYISRDSDISICDNSNNSIYGDILKKLFVEVK